MGKRRSHKIQASVVGVQSPNVTRENKDQRDLRSKWVPFFLDSSNVYINDLAKRKRRSPTHGAVLKSKAIYSVGNGLAFREDGEPVELSSKQQEYFNDVNGRGESLDEVFAKVQSDFIDFGNTYFEEKLKKARKNIWHKDATTVRVDRKSEVAYLSAFWRDIGLDDQFPNKQFPITAIDMSGNNKIVHIKNYEAEFGVYGVIDHTGALIDSDIEYKISTFNLDKLENGFFPSVLLQMFGEPPDGMEPDEYLKSIVKKFTGEGNGRKVLAELLDSKEQAANVHEFGSPQMGEFETLKELAKVSIIEAHRWHPALMMQMAGKLSNSSDIRTAYELVKNTVIPSYRKPVLKALKKALIGTPLEGLDLWVKPLTPVSMMDKIDPMQIWSLEELREETGKSLGLEEGHSLVTKQNNASITIDD